MHNQILCHPLADVFPPMSESEFADLCADIFVHGLREDITLFEGRILDGRNRYRACLETGVPPRFQEWDGAGSPESFIISMNLRRRHLDESQRAMVAARLTVLECNRPVRQSSCEAGEKITGFSGKISQTEAADLLNVSPRSVSSAVKVLKAGVLDLAERVEAGEISVSAAASLAARPKGKQKRLLAKKNTKIVNLAKEVKVASTLKQAKSTFDLCLVCNPPPKNEITEERFIAYLQVLARQLGGDFRRYVNSIIEEIEDLGVAEDIREHYELIFAAIDQGFQTERDIQRYTKLDLETIRFELEMMTGGGTLEVLPQGGKTAEARGQVKQIYRRVENQNYHVPEGYADAGRLTV